MTEIDFETLTNQGDIKTLTGLEALALRLKQKLLLQQGELFWNTTAGVPYRDQILTKPVDVGLAASLLNKQILDDPEVNSILKLYCRIDGVTRQLVYKVTISTIYGETEVGL